MPDVTVSADVDSMLRSANDAAIRSAIGVGQTDAPTFLGVNINANGAVPESGMAWSGSNHLAFFHNSAIRMVVLSTGTTIGSDMAYSWGSAGIPTSASRDLILARDAAGILAQRNGVAKQTLRIYNTYTSASIYERAVMDWNGPTPNTLQIGTEFTGAGMAACPIDFMVGGVVRMSIATSGNATLTGSLTIGQAAVFAHSGRVLLSSPSVGVYLLQNNTQNDFGRIQLGGTTSAFPAIKRNGTGIDIVLANDSGFAPLTASTVVASTTTIGPAGLNLGNSAGTISLGGTRLDLGTATTTAVQLFSGSTGSPMLLFGGVASAHPAFKRSTTSLQARLADDSAFTNIQGKLTTDTAYTATVVAATGYITIYDSTGTAYRVPCAV